MKKFVTLNEYIASLQKIAQTHGEEALISIGACCGTFAGIESPLSLRLEAEGKQRSYYVPAYKTENKVDSPWKEGRLQIGGGIFHFWIKGFDEGSEFGIEGGKISKLTIKNERTGKEVVNYDRGWDIQPNTKAAKQALDWVLRNFN